jgi:hypothetical protein
MRFLLGDPAAAESIRRASRELMHAFGPGHFDFGRAVFAYAFSYAPVPAVRGLMGWASFMDGNARRAADGARRLFGRPTGEEDP